MVKQGDVFTAYREGFPTENVIATMDFQKDMLLHCVNSKGQEVYVRKGEIGEILGNIDEMSS